MRILNLIITEKGLIENLTSFIIDDDQLSGEIINEAETLFKQEILKKYPEYTEDDLETYVENNSFDNLNGWSIDLIYSNEIF